MVRKEKAMVLAEAVQKLESMIKNKALVLGELNEEIKEQRELVARLAGDVVSGQKELFEEEPVNEETGEVASDAQPEWGRGHKRGK